MSEKKPTMKEIEGMLADYVTLTIKLPKEVAEWFKIFTSDLAETLEDELVQVCWAQVDSADSKLLMDKFCLKPVFQKYGLLSK